MNQHRCDRISKTSENEWAVILAGGDGTRLKSLTRHIAGDERPKQFCSVLGHGTLLEETQNRVALEFAPPRTLYVVNRAHENYYMPILSCQSPENLVVQPRNRGTAPAILYSLLRIAARDPQGVVAFFPSDHYISDNEKFMAQIRTALDTAHKRPDRVTLLGLEPESPEVEYGWIEPGRLIHRQFKVFSVRRFWEKPNKMLAQVLQLRGCLWNSFVMVGQVQTFLGLVKRAVPDLYDAFAAVVSSLGGPDETEAVRKLYSRLPTIDFSSEVLTESPSSLAVMPVYGVTWSDLGSPERVMRARASMELTHRQLLYA